MSWIIIHLWKICTSQSNCWINISGVGGVLVNLFLKKNDVAVFSPFFQVVSWAFFSSHRDSAANVDHPLLHRPPHAERDSYKHDQWPDTCRVRWSLPVSPQQKKVTPNHPQPKKRHSLFGQICISNITFSKNPKKNGPIFIQMQKVWGIPFGEKIFPHIFPMGSWNSSFPPGLGELLIQRDFGHWSLNTSIRFGQAANG